MTDKTNKPRAMLDRLAAKLRDDMRFFAGWVPDDDHINELTRGRLQISTAQWTHLLLNELPQNMDSPESDAAFDDLAGRIGVPDDLKSSLASILWRSRALAALRISAGAAPTEVAARLSSRRTFLAFRTARTGNVSGLRPAWNAMDALPEATPSGFDHVDSDWHHLEIADRTMEVDRSVVESAFDGAGLEPARIDAHAGWRFVRSGHIKSWPLALLGCADPRQAAVEELAAATGRSWSADTWPRAANSAVLLGARGFGLACLGSSTRIEDVWILAQTVAAFLLYLTSYRSERQLGARILPGDSSLSPTEDRIELFVPVGRAERLDRDLLLRPEIDLALRLVAPIEQLPRSISGLREAKEQLAQQLLIPQRVARLRILQVYGTA